MFGKVWSSCVQGIDGQIIEVEVDLSNGLPQVNLVGLPDSAVRESTERVRAAIRNCNYTFPMQRITVNLAPADVRKEGSSYDLAIAMGILLTSGQIQEETVKNTLLIGELALDGTLRPVPGVLAMVHHGREQGLKRVILPAANAPEARLIEGVDVLPIRHLNDIRIMMQPDAAEYRELALLQEASWEAGTDAAAVPGTGTESAPLLSSALETPDFADVCGQLHAKRALMIVAAGFHNVILIGPPGTGKTMLIRRLPGILPKMTELESLEVTKIFSVAGKLANRTQFIQTRPFRSPHHTVSAAGLIGGGSIPKPGEASLAHRGVLFLDELPEFSRMVLEVLRQPLEDRQVTIGRARAAYTFPSHFMLAASMNPCPCGYYGADSLTHACTCSPLKIEQYRSKISGPLLDRMDLQVEVPRIDYGQIVQNQPQLSSEAMRAQVDQARQIQLERYRHVGITYNGELQGRSLRTYCKLRPDAEGLLKKSFEVLGLSVRAYDRILKIARTIADLEGSPHIEMPHLAEALQYRSLDKKTHLPASYR